VLAQFASSEAPFASDHARAWRTRSVAAPLERSVQGNPPRGRQIRPAARRPGGRSPVTPARRRKKITITGSTAVIGGERVNGTTESGRIHVVSIDDQTEAVLRQRGPTKSPSN